MLCSSGTPDEQPRCYVLLVQAPGERPRCYVLLVQAPGERPRCYVLLVRAPDEQPRCYVLLVRAPGERQQCYVLLQGRRSRMLPYSGKLSREKTFADWWKIKFRGVNFRGCSLVHAPRRKLCVGVVTDCARVDREGSC